MPSRKSKLLKDRVQDLKSSPRHKIRNFEGELTIEEQIAQKKQQIKLCDYDLHHSCRGNLVIENKLVVLKQQLEKLTKRGEQK